MYAQHKSGQKLHVVYDLGELGHTQPVCGRRFNRFRMTINVPLGHSCKACWRRLESQAFNEKEFIRQAIEA